MPRFIIHHVTKYAYESPVRDSANQVMLYPVKDNYQEVLKQELTITGQPVVDIYKDYYGNEVGAFMYTDPHNEMVIDSKIEVITKTRRLPEATANNDAQWDYLQSINYDIPFIDFLKQEPFVAVAEIKQVTQLEEFCTVAPLMAAQRLNEYVYTNFEYIQGVTSVETT